MTLNIEFTLQEEAWLNAQALRQGLPPAEIIKKMIDEKLTPEPNVRKPLLWKLLFPRTRGCLPLYAELPSVNKAEGRQTVRLLSG